MARTSKKCIFCCGAPTTREHIWADWLKAFIPKDLPKHSSVSSILNPDRTIDKSSQVWGGDVRSRRLQIVCGPCNQGWMHDLQDVTKPILIPLIKGETMLLGTSEQHTLATWCAMTAICAEYFQPKRRGVPVTDRRWLYVNRTAPESWKIWIGNYQREEWIPHWVHTSLRIADHEFPKSLAVHTDGVPWSNVQTTTMVIGQLYMHAFSCPFPEILEMIQPDSRAIRFLAPIWPKQESVIAWPINAMGDREADDFAGSIFNALDAAAAAFGA
jgi:hypothetical protein